MQPMPPPPHSAPELEPELNLGSEVLWQGSRSDLLTKGSYTVTSEQIIFSDGLVSTKEEMVPLWAVRDLDVRQNLDQKVRKVGTVTVRLEHNEYTGKSEVLLHSIKDPKYVRDLIQKQASVARQRRLEAVSSIWNTQTIRYEGVPAASSPASMPVGTPVPDLADQLTKLAALRDSGILTEEEFADQKRKWLS